MDRFIVERTYPDGDVFVLDTQLRNHVVGRFGTFELAREKAGSLNREWNEYVADATDEDLLEYWNRHEHLLDPTY